ASLVSCSRLLYLSSLFLFNVPAPPDTYALSYTTLFRSLTDPHLSVFGRKDAQQLAIIQRLVEDLELGVRIEPVEIQRESSGLARSSRNAYLDDAGREQALVLSRTLRSAEAAAPSLEGLQQVLREAAARAA